MPRLLFLNIISHSKEQKILGKLPYPESGSHIGMAQAEPGTSCCAKTQESCQRLMWSFQKDIEASFRGLPSGTLNEWNIKVGNDCN